VSALQGFWRDIGKTEKGGQEKTKKGKTLLEIMVKLTIFVVLGTILITTLLVFGLGKTGQAGQGTIEVSPKEYDAGIVSMAGELVKKTFEIKNIGQGDLKITDISTSCMCTTARLRVGDKISPEFGMAGMDNASTFWSQKIAPGEMGELEVTFDQALHGEAGLGDIVRAIYIQSDDAQHPRAEVKLTAKVVK